jgi:hypothetical protein
VTLLEQNSGEIPTTNPSQVALLSKRTIKEHPISNATFLGTKTLFFDFEVTKPFSSWTVSQIRLWINHQETQLVSPTLSPF